MKTKRRSRSFTEARTRVIDRLNAIECYKPENAYFKAWDIMKEIKEDFNITQIAKAELKGIIYVYAQILWYQKCKFLYFHEGVPYKDQYDYQTINDLKMQGHHVWIDNGNIYAVKPITTT